MNSRAKGARGEREFAAFLQELGVEARRGQQFSGGPGSPDVVADLPVHPEVKFTNALQMWPAIEQAEHDAKGKPWAVFTRRTTGPFGRRRWVAIVDAKWLVQILKGDKHE